MLVKHPRGMGIDSMRVGGGRCPPLLVGGLLIACLMMLCNWWTLSSTNLELLRQIDELNEQIRISVEERDQCITERGIHEKRLKNCQDEARTNQVKFSQVDDTLSTCKKELDSYKNIDTTRTATLEALRVDKKAITTQLETKQEENKKLKEDLSKVKDQLEKLKLSMNAPPPQLPAVPNARLLEKSPIDNKTVANAVNSQNQVNPPSNVVQNAEAPDNAEKDADTAAEVDGNNAVDPDPNLNLMSDLKDHNAQK